MQDWLSTMSPLLYQFFDVYFLPFACKSKGNVNFLEDYKSENQRKVVFNHPSLPLSKWRHWLGDPRASIKKNNEQNLTYFSKGFAVAVLIDKFRCPKTSTECLALRSSRDTESKLNRRAERFRVQREQMFVYLDTLAAWYAIFLVSRSSDRLLRCYQWRYTNECYTPIDWRPS